MPRQVRIEFSERFNIIGFSHLAKTGWRRTFFRDLCHRLGSRLGMNLQVEVRVYLFREDPDLPKAF